ncbi:MAG: hypothetical protein ACK4LQ_10080 [Pararhodobacter sp.]
MMNRFLAAATLACVAFLHAPGIARAGTVVAICKSGGCQCLLSPLTTEELAAFAGEIFGGDTPVDRTRDTLVYEPDLGIVTWVDAPRGAINRSFGGTDECPIELFPEPETMVPLDGTWQWRTLGETALGCPPMLAGALAASRVETLTTRVNWNGRFDPRRLASSLPQPEMAGMSPYEWRETGPFRWLSDNIRGRSCEDGTCVDSALALNMTLVAPDRITGFLSLRSRVEGGAAAVLASFGMRDCRVRVRYEIRHIAP